MKIEEKIIKRARLGLLEPEKVYEELIRYKEELSSKRINLDWVWGDDDKLEIELLRRNEPLIDLGLAQAASTKEVVSTLWTKYDAKDQTMALAVKIGILGGMNVSAIPSEEIINIIKGKYVGNFDEKDNMTYALLENKHARRLVVENLLNKKPPFDSIPEERMLVLLNAVKSNECLNIDTSDSESPDLTYWSIRDGLFKIINNAPVSKNWLYAIYDLLLAINEKYYTKDEFNLDQFVAKWRMLPDDESTTSMEGWYTNLTLIEEFLCLVVCIFGFREFSKDIKLSENEKLDVVYRSGYYSKAYLSTKQISEAIEKDGSLFIMSALYNYDLLLSDNKRKIIEESLSVNLVHLYNDRIKFLKQKYPHFKPQLIQENDFTKEANSNVDFSETINSLNASIKIQYSEILNLKQFIYGGAIAFLIISLIQRFF
jgi:hypothetical protein